MNKLKEFFSKTPIKIALKLVKGVLVVFLALFILVVALQRFSGNKLSFFNYRMFTVITGSMEPKYQVGDILIAKETDPVDIKVGDAVSYLGNRNDFTGKVVTHEVIKVTKDENTNKFYFHTKGLANLVEDPVVSEDQLYGVVIYKSIILSAIYKIVSNTVGFYLFIIIPLMFIIGSEIITSLLEKEEARRNKSKKSE